MRFTLCLFSTLSIALLSVASAHADQHENKKEDIVKKIGGGWAIIAGANQGRQLSAERVEGTTVLINKNFIITYDRDQNERYKATYTIDASKSPIQIDMVSMMEGSEAASAQQAEAQQEKVQQAKALGIIKLSDDGQKFELCYALPGGKRPSKFESPEGSKVMWFKMDRIVEEKTSEDSDQE